MQNPNDKTAIYYDKVSEAQKPDVITDSEVKMVSDIIKFPSTILDIGCGTGRHLIKLLELGFEVDGIDSSVGMLNVLNEKLRSRNLKSKITLGNFLSLDIVKKYDLLILFWNTFNEMILTEDNLKVFFLKAKNLLKNGGILLINIDDAKLIDPSNFNYSTSETIDGETFKLRWSTQNYDKKTNTSVSMEDIEVIDEKNQVIFKSTELITQRYWYLEEVLQIAKAAGFGEHKLLKNKFNEELYILL